MKNEKSIRRERINTESKHLAQGQDGTFLFEKDARNSASAGYSSSPGGWRAENID